MDNLLRDSTPLELAAWLEADGDFPAWDRLKGCPFGSSLAGVQNYFAEYHLEFFRQRRFEQFPSRLHALSLFATRIDAQTFQNKHPDLVFGKRLLGARTCGAYVCSFHDASWLDYLRLPHNLDLLTLDTVAEHYWSGRTVEEIGLGFMGDPWREPPVIEALFQGTLETRSDPTPYSGWLPGFAGISDPHSS